MCSLPRRKEDGDEGRGGDFDSRPSLEALIQKYKTWPWSYLETRDLLHEVVGDLDELRAAVTLHKMAIQQRDPPRKKPAPLGGTKDRRKDRR